MKMRGCMGGEKKDFSYVRNGRLIQKDGNAFGYNSREKWLYPANLAKVLRFKESRQYPLGL
jgi:hypothetical protein